MKKKLGLLAVGLLIGCVDTGIDPSSQGNLPDHEVQIVRSDAKPGKVDSVINEDTYSFNYVQTAADPLSTFALDVDEGSYTLFRSNAKRNYFDQSRLYRVEEFLNYFEYSIPSSEGEFSLYSEWNRSLFRSNYHDLRITLSAPAFEIDRPLWNLTLVIDNSGSMQYSIPLVKSLLAQLVDQTVEGDKISIVTYSGQVDVLLEPTLVKSSTKAEIKGILDAVQSTGATYMSGGVRKGYEVNAAGLIQGGVNRVIICSDGDANVGTTDWEGMLEEIAGYKSEGIFLTNLGFGGANYNEENMEQLADKGNGNYYYIDDASEAERFITEELGSATQLFAIDAKVQVVFDSTQVKAYRLRGYENRAISDEDFNQDTTDAGEIGFEHQVTAVYEIQLDSNYESTRPIAQFVLKYKDLAYTNLTQEFVIDQGSLKSSEGLTDDQIFILYTAEYVELLNGYFEDKADKKQAIQSGLMNVKSEDDKKNEFIEIVNQLIL